MLKLVFTGKDAGVIEVKDFNDVPNGIYFATTRDGCARVLVVYDGVFDSFTLQGEHRWFTEPLVNMSTGYENIHKIDVEDNRDFFWKADEIKEVNPNV